MSNSTSDVTTVWIAGITLHEDSHLLKWKGKAGQAQKFQLLSRVMSKWKQLGTLLGFGNGGDWMDAALVG